MISFHRDNKNNDNLYKIIKFSIKPENGKPRHELYAFPWIIIASLGY